MSGASWAAILAAAFAVATMPVFALLARGRPPDAEVAARPASQLLGYWIRNWLMWFIGPVESRLVRWGVSPDALNVAGAVLGLAAGVAYAAGELASGGALVLLGGAADVLDGRIARARGLVSTAGEFLDSSLDRFAEIFAFAGLAVALAPSRIGVLSAVAALGGSMAVSYVRARGQGLRVDYRGGLMQRAERIVLLAVGSLFGEPIARVAGWPSASPLIAILALIGVGALATAIHRLLYVVRELRTPGRSA